MNNFEIPIIADDFEEPLAVRVDGPHGDIPADGWPEDYKPEIIGRLLSYMPQE